MGLDEKQKEIWNRICPKCGNEMDKTEHPGGYVYNCSNFRCTYTVNVPYGNYIHAIRIEEMELEQ